MKLFSDRSQEEALAMRVSINSIAVNLILTITKLIAGVFAHSSAMLSDAVHSASDVFSTIVVMIGIRIANLEPDDNHRYGHERFECVASLLLAILLGLTGLGIGMNGIEKIFGRSGATLAVPGTLALAAAVLSIAVKEIMYWYTRAAAKKVNSGALMADAWHHRSDALSSVGSFLGIFFSRRGYPVMDSVASLVICLFILKAAWDILRDALRKMTDESCDEETIGKMRDVILGCEGVLGIDEIKTRLFGNRIYVDIEICADGTKTLYETHQIAENVHHSIEEAFSTVKHCMVHVNPAQKSE